MKKRIKQIEEQSENILSKVIGVSIGVTFAYFAYILTKSSF